MESWQRKADATGKPQCNEIDTCCKNAMVEGGERVKAGAFPWKDAVLFLPCGIALLDSLNGEMEGRTLGIAPPGRKPISGPRRAV